MKPIKINSTILSQLTMCVTFSTPFRLRLRLAAKLLHLAAWVAGMHFEGKIIAPRDDMDNQERKERDAYTTKP